MSILGVCLQDVVTYKNLDLIGLKFCIIITCEKSIFKNWPCSFVRFFMDLDVILVHRH